MKMVPAIVLILVCAGLFGLLQGCASSPDTMDTEQIRGHADEGFKELQKEEDLQEKY